MPGAKAKLSSLRAIGDFASQRAILAFSSLRAIVTAIETGYFLLFKNISDTASTSESGIVSSQDYCGPTYFREDYVGDASYF
jgi:hypothetical protein